MRRTAALVGVILGATVLVAAASPAQAGGGTYSVTSGADSGAGTWRDALAAASAFAGPSTITVQTGLLVSVTGGDVQYTGTGPLTIIGQGATIDGTDTQRLLRSPNSSVSIQDLTFRDAGSDGAVEAASTNGITVTDSTFISNQASDGGGIETGSGPITVTNSTFTGNTASIDGAAVDTGTGTVIVTGSTFTGNTAGSSGGAIHSSGGDITVVDSTFTGNTADSGGAIRTNTGDVTVTGSTFDGNDAVDGDGGAVFANDTLVSITNSTFHDNTATSQGGTIHSRGDLRLTHVTASAGAAPEGAFVESAGVNAVLTSTSTVLAQPLGSTACSRDNASVSGGHNRVADSSCLLAEATDQQAGFFLLGPLADNGGPTRTRLPGNGLADMIPAVDCDPGVTVDQRGEGRPQGEGCDVGAVELEAAFQPDALIRNSNQAAFAGNNVYNHTGVGQTRAQTRARGAKATFVVRLSNDGTTVDRLRLRGRGTTNRHTVRYRVGTTNVTSAVVAGTYRTPALQPGASVTVTVEITVRNAAPRGSTKHFGLTTRSDTHPNRRDVVKATVKVPR